MEELDKYYVELRTIIENKKQNSKLFFSDYLFQTVFLKWHLNPSILIVSKVSVLCVKLSQQHFLIN